VTGGDRKCFILVSSPEPSIKFFLARALEFDPKCQLLLLTVILNQHNFGANGDGGHNRQNERDLREIAPFFTIRECSSRNV
jgi:hypothetical protein